MGRVYLKTLVCVLATQVMLVQDLPNAENDRSVNLERLKKFGEIYVHYSNNSVYLDKVILSGPKVDDRAMKCLNYFDEIQEIEFDNTNITDAGFNEIRHFRFVKALRINGAKITDKSFDIISKFKYLNSLSIQDTRLSGRNLVKLQELPELESLFLGGVPVTKQAILGLTSVVNLALMNCDLKDEKVVLLQNLKNLRILKLDDQTVSIKGLISALHQTKLEQLKLGAVDGDNSDFDNFKRLYPNIKLSSSPCGYGDTKK